MGLLAFLGDVGSDGFPSIYFRTEHRTRNGERVSRAFLDVRNADVRNTSAARQLDVGTLKGR
jgi:hypothetical protein